MSAMTRGLLVTRFSSRSSPPDGWTCLFWVGLPVELLTELRGGDRLSNECPHHCQPARSKVREARREKGSGLLEHRLGKLTLG